MNKVKSSPLLSLSSMPGLKNVVFRWMLNFNPEMLLQAMEGMIQFQHEVWSRQLQILSSASSSVERVNITFDDCSAWDNTVDVQTVLEPGSLGMINQCNWQALAKVLQKFPRLFDLELSVMTQLWPFPDVLKSVWHTHTTTKNTILQSLPRSLKDCVIFVTECNHMTNVLVEERSCGCQYAILRPSEGSFTVVEISTCQDHALRNNARH